jgi:hypothetical protein
LSTKPNLPPLFIGDTVNTLTQENIMTLMDAKVTRSPDEPIKEAAIAAFKNGTLTYAVYRLLPDVLKQLYVTMHGRAPRNVERDSQLRLSKTRKLAARKKRQKEAKQARKRNRG